MEFRINVQSPEDFIKLFDFLSEQTGDSIMNIILDSSIISDEYQLFSYVNDEMNPNDLVLEKITKEFYGLYDVIMSPISGSWEVKIIREYDIQVDTIDNIKKSISSFKKSSFSAHTNWNMTVRKMNYPKSPSTSFPDDFSVITYRDYTKIIEENSNLYLKSLNATSLDIEMILYKEDS